MIELSSVEERLALFAEGISGRYLHIRASGDEEATWQSLDALYLPERIDSDDPHGYHVQALQQIGQRECGTFSFDMAQARLRLGLPITDRAQSRDSELTLFFREFPQPAPARALFRALDLVRIDGHIRRTYPGARKYMPPEVPDIVQMAAGVGIDVSGLGEPGHDVYEVAAATMALYPLLCGDLEAITPLATEDVSGVEWMQREERVESLEDEAAELSQQILAVEMMESEETGAQTREGLDGETRDNAPTLSQLERERDTLQRRIDMERAALRVATGGPRPATRSYRYDEWDMHSRRYIKRHCLLYEQRQAPDLDADLEALRRVVRTWIGAVKTQLEQIRPSGLQRVRKVLDGDELDLNSLMEARQDTLAGSTPDERVYSRRERVQRDVCALFLVDLSASTDDPIEPPEPVPLDEWGDPINLRDPFEDHPMFSDLESSAEATPRKIIDVQREAMLVMATALEALGDNFGIYGFSGYGHDCAEIFVSKEIGEAFSSGVLRSIAAMAPKRSTRMGPAIRHSTAKLVESGHAMRVLIVVSDGFPQDCDYGPDRGDHEYGLMDTARALEEAAAKGVETFCITVDRSGHDYLKRMCPEARYMVIEEMEDLPGALSKVYGALTGR